VVYSYIYLQKSLARRNKMRRQIIWQIKAVKFNANQMHCKCKFVGVKHSVLVHV